MKDDSALKPEVFSSIPQFIQNQRTGIIDDKAEEEILASGADQGFWTILHKHFNESIEVLEAINEQAIASGMNFEEIGRNALVISQVKGVLKKIINIVEDSREAKDARDTK